MLFLPIAFGMHSLYEWSHEGITATDPIIAQKALYLNTPFFLARQAFYFLVWGTIGHLLTRGRPSTIAPAIRRCSTGCRSFPAADCSIYVLTVTFAMVDWTMSVNPHWFSTIWGMLYIGGQGLSAFAFGICVLVMLSQTAPLNRVLTTHHFHDLGKLLFAFLMLWAYLSFSQFLIIWSANIPEEIPHYLDRWENSWQLPERLHRRRAFHACRTRCCCRAISSATWASCASSPRGSCSRGRRLLLAHRAGAPKRRAVDQPARRRAAARAGRDLHFVVRVETRRPFAAAGQRSGN